MSSRVHAVEAHGRDPVCDIGWHLVALFLGWVAACIAGAFAGLALVGGLGAILMVVAAIAPVAVGLLTAATILLAGAVQGAVMGFAQSLVLAHAIPSMPRSTWIRATVIGAVAAWVLALALSGFSTTGEPVSPALMAIAMLVTGTVLGLVLGYAQWRVLRAHLRGAGWWMVANAIGWAAGLAVAYRAAQHILEGGELIGVATASAVSGTGGPFVGVATGLALVALLARTARLGRRVEG